MNRVRPERNPQLTGELGIPYFVRSKDYREREKNVDRARKRRRTRINAFTILFFGASLAGGGIAALLLGMMFSQVAVWQLIPSAIVCVLGYRMLRMGAEDYVTSLNDTYEDANVV